MKSREGNARLPKTAVFQMTKKVLAARVVEYVFLSGLFLQKS